MIHRYSKFILESESFDFTKEEIEECFVDLMDDYDAIITSFINKSTVSVIIFILFEKWKSDRAVQKLVSDCFIRLRDITGLIQIEKRDRKSPKIGRESNEYWMVSRNLSLK